MRRWTDIYGSGADGLEIEIVDDPQVYQQALERDRACWCDKCAAIRSRVRRKARLVSKKGEGT